MRINCRSNTFLTMFAMEMITMIDDRTATVPRNMSLKQYRKMKLKMLERDFCIRLTDAEREYANTLTTEIAIDQFCLGILNNRWDR